MNIHIRAIKRLLKTMMIPVMIGISVGALWTMLTATQIVVGLSIGLLGFTIWLFYIWTLDQIRQEDQLKEFKEFTNKE